MAVLSAAQRRKIPKSEYGEPGEDKYPMPDWQHAANAKSRAKQQLNAGRLSRDAYDKIVAKANRVMSREKK
jgi:hypothetical protein